MMADLLVALDGETAVHIILQVLKARPAVAPAIIGYACPGLTYAPARGMMERRCRGVLKTFDRGQGFGYIASPEIEAAFGMDVLVKNEQVGPFEVGEELSFSCALGEGNKPQAFELLTASGLVHPGHGSAGVGAGATAGHAPGSEWADWNNWQPGGSSASNGCAGTADDSDPKRRKLEIEESPIGEFSGIFKSYNESNGFGFIESSALKAQGYTIDVLLHSSQQTGILPGSIVNFTAYKSKEGQLMAKDVKIAPPGTTP